MASKNKSKETAVKKASPYTMRYRLHGGADEIGGNFIEIESAGKRIFLDMGMPLSLPEEGLFSSQQHPPRYYRIAPYRNRAMPRYQNSTVVRTRHDIVALM